METIKISELPSSTQWTGLYALGVDSNNNSVKISLDELQENADVIAAANLVLSQAQGLYDQMLLMTERLCPTAMDLPNAINVPVDGDGDDMPAVLTPGNALPNFIYQIVSGTSAYVRPDGKIFATSIGSTTAWVIPVGNVGIWKSINIVGYQPAIVFAGSVMRLTELGSLRLT